MRLAPRAIAARRVHHQFYPEIRLQLEKEQAAATPDTMHAKSRLAGLHPVDEFPRRLPRLCVTVVLKETLRAMCYLHARAASTASPQHQGGQHPRPRGLLPLRQAGRLRHLGRQGDPIRHSGPDVNTNGAADKGHPGAAASLAAAGSSPHELMAWHPNRDQEKFDCGFASRQGQAL